MGCMVDLWFLNDEGFWSMAVVTRLLGVVA